MYDNTPIKLKINKAIVNSRRSNKDIEYLQLGIQQYAELISYCEDDISKEVRNEMFEGIELDNTWKLQIKKVNRNNFFKIIYKNKKEKE